MGTLDDKRNLSVGKRLTAVYGAGFPLDRLKRAHNQISQKEEVILNKSKRLFSIFLAAVMVFTIVPGGVFSYETPTTPGTVETHMPVWYTDTSETTRTTRIGQGDGSYLYGGNIVRTTAEGIPYSNDTGNYSALSFAGDSTEVVPTVVFSITGKKEDIGSIALILNSNSNGPTAYLDEPGKEENIINLNYAVDQSRKGGYTSTTADANGFFTRTWAWTYTSPPDGICGNSFSERSKVLGHTIVFDVPFNLNNDVDHTYHDYAYSCIQDILRPSGVQVSMYYKYWNSSTTINFSSLTIHSSNSVSGKYSSSPSTSNNPWGYYDYSRASENSNTLATSEYGNRDITYLRGTGYYKSGELWSASEGAFGALELADDGSTRVQDYSYVSQWCIEDGWSVDTKYNDLNDTSKFGKTTVYLDTSREHLGTGTSGGKTGLGLRFYAHSTAIGGAGSSLYIKSVQIASGNYSSSLTYSTSSNGVTIDQSKIGSTNGQYYSGSLAASSLASAAKTVKFSGDGSSLTSGANNFTVRSATIGYYRGSGSHGSPSTKDTFIQPYNYFPITINKYDTTNLRTLYNGINRGDSSSTYSYYDSSYNTQVGTAHYNDCYPGRVFYADVSDSTWNSFVNAYVNAGKVIAKFATSQTEVDSAYKQLSYWYHELGTPKNYTLTVKYVDEDGNALVAPEVETVESGTYYSTTAAEFNGYTFDQMAVGSALQSGLVVSNTTVTYVYKANTYTARYYPNLPDDDGYSLYQIKYGERLPFKAGDNPNFSATTAPKDFASTAGFRDHYKVEGYYSNANFTAASKYNTSTATMPVAASGIDIYTKWEAKKVQLKVNKSFDGSTVNLGAAQTPVMKDGELDYVTFNIPSENSGNFPSSLIQSGYEFMGFYTDAAFTNKVEGSTKFYYNVDTEAGEVCLINSYNGDTINDDVILYARYVNLENKIYIEPEGGTIEEGYSNPKLFSQGERVYAPAVTRKGYTFTGWTYKNGNPITEWNNSQPITMTSNIGFIAYAGWRANDVTILFDSNIPETETRYYFNTYNNNSYNGNSCFAYITGKVDNENTALTPYTSIYGVQNIPSSVNIPRRFGYKFAYWQDETGHKFDFSKFPKEDTTVKAVWVIDDSSAFVSLTAYEKLGGSLVQVGTVGADGAWLSPETIAQNTQISANPIAQRGDVVTVRMNSITNFYTGACMFIYMYDKNFFEPYVPSDDGSIPGTTVDYVSCNDANSFISAISGEANHNIDDDALEYIWPDSIAGKMANYSAVIVSIDPQDYTKKTALMNDQSWLIELRFKIKSTATGSGVIYMDNAWTRCDDNPAGYMFYGYSSDEANIWTTTNNRVVPDLSLAYTEVKLANTNVKPNGTLTAKIDKTVTVNGVAKVDSSIAFAQGTLHNVQTSGTTSYIVYTGAQTTEIYDFPTPTRTGYDAYEYWVKESLKNDAGYTYSALKAKTQQELDALCTSGNIWYAGYYANAGQNGNTYVPVWVPKTYTVTFLNANGANYSQVQVDYDAYIASPASAPTKPNNDFNGWVNQDTGETFDASYIGGKQMSVCAGDTTFVPQFIGAVKGIRIVPEADGVTFNSTSATRYVNLDSAAQDAIVALGNGSEYARYGMTVKIVKTIPAVKEDDTTYILIDDIAQYLASDGKDVFTDDNGQAKWIIDTDAAENNGVSTQVTATAANNLLAVKMKVMHVTVTFKPNGGTFPAGTALTDGNYVIDVEKYGTVNVASIPSPTKPGYTFSKWGNLTNQTVIESSTSYTATYIAKNVNIYIVDANGVAGSDSISAKFGSVFDMYIIDEEDLTPEKAGYTLSGYYVAQKSGSSFVKSTVDTTLYDPDDDSITINNTAILYEDGNEYELYFMPEFTVNQYSVKFDKNWPDGSTVNKIDTVTGDFGSVISKPADPTFTGYEFLGWATSKTASAPNVTFTATAPTIPGNDTTVYYAVWKAAMAQYKVEYYLENADGTYSQNTNLTETLQAQVATTVSPSGKAVTNYAFNATKSDSNVAVAANNSTVVKAYYDRVMVNYSLIPSYETFDGNTTYYQDSDTPIVRQAKWGTSVTVNTSEFAGTVYERTGYSLNTAPVSIASVAVDGSSSAQVKFDLISYTIIYQNEDGSEIRRDTVKYTAPLTPPTPQEKTGYQFGGWAIIQGNTFDLQSMTMPAEDVTLKATYRIGIYYITFYDGDNVINEPKGFEYGAQTSAEGYTPANRTGYTFTNTWYENSDCTGNPYVFTTMPAENISLYAAFAINEYDLSFYDGNTLIKTLKFDYNTSTGSGNSPAADKYGETVTAPQKTGNTFKGWSGTAGGYTEYTFDSMPANEVKVYAFYDLNTINYTFLAKDGSEYRTVTGDYGTTVNVPAAKTETGYDFVKWSPDVPATFGAQDQTFTPEYTEKVYKISYQVDNVTEHSGISDVDSIKFGDTIPQPQQSDAFYMKGNTFEGWYKDSALTPESKLQDGAKMGDIGASGSTLILYPGFTVNTYTLVIDTTAAPDGEVKTLRDQPYGSAQSVSQVPVYAGHDFVNWQIQCADASFSLMDDTASELSFRMPAADLTITAVYTEHIYASVYFVNPSADNTGANVTFPENVADYTAFSTYTVDYGTQGTGVQLGEAIQVPAGTPEVEYFNFTGWYTDPVKEEGFELPAAMPALENGEILYVYPHYERVKVTLQVEGEDGRITLSILNNSTAKLVMDKDDDKKPLAGPVETFASGTENYQYDVFYIKDFAESLGCSAIGSQLGAIGNGSLNITSYYESAFGVTTIDACGTGSIVDVIDNVTGQIVERYYIVILGDVNGDAVANSTDASFIRTFGTNRGTITQAQELAADVNSDGIIDNADKALVLAIRAGKAVYDRVTGEFIK